MKNFKSYLIQIFEIFIIFIFVCFLNYFLLFFLRLNNVDLNHNVFYILDFGSIADYSTDFFDYYLFFFYFFFKGEWILFIFFYFNHLLNFYLVFWLFNLLYNYNHINNILFLKNNIFVYLYFLFLFILLKSLFWFTDLIICFREVWCFSFLYFIFSQIIFGLFYFNIIQKNKFLEENDKDKKIFQVFFVFLFFFIIIVTCIFSYLDLLPLTDKKFFFINERYFR